MSDSPLFAIEIKLHRNGTGKVFVDGVDRGEFSTCQIETIVPSVIDRALGHQTLTKLWIAGEGVGCLITEVQSLGVREQPPAVSIIECDGVE